MRVGVVIPCYRDAATLAAALASVHAQTRPVDEVIVVDDCSPESAAIQRIVQGYPFVRYIRNSENLGLAASRNVGIRAMTAEVASFLDADDLLHPQKIELQLSVFSHDIAVSCRVDRIPRFTEPPAARFYGPDFAVRTFSDSRKLIRRNRLTGAAMMISRELLLRLGGYDERLRSCEDFDLWLRLLDSGVRAVDVRLPLYLYRMNPAGLSRNACAISRWELEVVGAYLRRRDPAFPAGMPGALTWAFWILKHLLRYERCRDDCLREATRGNMATLGPHRVIRAALTVIDRLRLLRPLAWAMEVRRRREESRCA